MRGAPQGSFMIFIMKKAAARFLLRRSCCLGARVSFSHLKRTTCFTRANLEAVSVPATHFAPLLFNSFSQCKATSCAAASAGSACRCCAIETTRRTLTRNQHNQHDREPQFRRSSHQSNAPALFLSPITDVLRRS